MDVVSSPIRACQKAGISNTKELSIDYGVP